MQRTESTHRTNDGVSEKYERQAGCRWKTSLRECKLTETVSGAIFKAPPASRGWRSPRRLRVRRTLVVLRIARGISGFDPRRGLAELFGNFAQELHRALFRFRGDFFLDKTLHAREFFVNTFPKVFEVFDALNPRELFVDALAELFEFIHG